MKPSNSKELYCSSHVISKSRVKLSTGDTKTFISSIGNKETNRQWIYYCASEQFVSVLQECSAALPRCPCDTNLQLQAYTGLHVKQRAAVSNPSFLKETWNAWFLRWSGPASKINRSYFCDRFLHNFFQWGSLFCIWIQFRIYFHIHWFRKKIIHKYTQWSYAFTFWMALYFFKVRFKTEWDIRCKRTTLPS